MSGLRLLGLLEAAGRLLRRIGLGRLVLAVRSLLESRFSLARPTEVDGLLMSGSSIGHLGHIRAWRDGVEEAYMSELYKGAIEPGMTVLDVGAYLGYFTLLGAREVGPSGRIVAFEPNPRSHAVLCRNIAENGFADRVEVVQKALSLETGTRAFFWDSADESRSALIAPDDVAGQTEVACTTVDEHLGAGTVPDVIKIDIEGGEVAALQGMRRTLAAAGEGLKLFVECNPEALSRFGASAEALLAELTAARLTPLLIDERSRELAPFDPAAMAGADHVNLLCARSGESPPG